MSPDPRPNFSQRAYAAVRLVPYGRVATYGAIASIMGHPRGARGVGDALSALPEDTDVPWWRIINRLGRISIRTPTRAAIQRVLIEGEGVVFGEDGGVDLARFGWPAEGDRVDDVD